MNIDGIAQKIINNPLFLKLKDVVENNPWHDHETVYDHLLKTFDIAKREIQGGFITNPKAKKLFLEFVNTTFENSKNADIMLITALVHDVGKLLYYRDGQEEKMLKHINQDGVTRFPGHEYLSSTIVGEVLKDCKLNEKIIQKIANVVRLHNTFNDPYFESMENWSIEEVVDDVKARAEGLYKEALFNIYCDEFNGKPSQRSIKKMVEIFNQPSLYTSREYFIK